MIDPVTEENARIAEEKYGVPRDVYIELSESFGNSQLLVYVMNQNAPMKSKLHTAYAFGMLIGYLKAQGKDDTIEEIIAGK